MYESGPVSLYGDSRRVLFVLIFSVALPLAVNQSSPLTFIPLTFLLLSLFTPLTVGTYTQISRIFHLKLSKQCRLAVIPLRKNQWRIQLRDPVPVWPRDPGWVKNQDPDPGSGMNIPDHISESFETIFWVKNTLMRIPIRDPESFWPWYIRIRNTGTNKICIFSADKLELIWVCYSRCGNHSKQGEMWRSLFLYG